MFVVEAMAKLGSVIAVAVLIVLVVVSLPRLRGNKPVGSERLIGRSLPQFAAPLTTGNSNKVANITQRQDQHPKSRPACGVNLPGVFNSCRVERQSLVLAFWSNRSSTCLTQIDAFNRAARQFPKTRFVAIGIDQQRSSAAAVARERGWSIPVAVDPDGAVSALYSVAGCPSTFFVSNGLIRAVRLGRVDRETLANELRKAG